MAIMHLPINICLICNNAEPLKAVAELHAPCEITLPNGEWGVGCIECNTFDYPCKTMKVLVNSYYKVKIEVK